MATDDDLANAATTMATPTSPRATSEPSLEVIDGARYTSRQQLGAGGMGKIVTAFDRRLGRTVAIKELRGQDAELVARFEREIALSAKLEHPAIVTIHDAGMWPSGEPFYVMRLVPGRSLADAIASAKELPARLALVPHVIAIADALAYAHGKRIIHRDLKPQNVMIGEFGETVVIDWGLAKERSASRSSTTSIDTKVETQLGDVLGTPAYMPPEQALGAATDERSDVYAIGAILYHVLAGKAPYEGATTEVLDQVKRGAPPALEPGAPADLLAIVQRAMAREPGDRYPSARELADDLRAFQAGRLVGAHRYSPGELFRRWVKTHRTALAVAAVAVVALAGIGAVSVYRIVQARAIAEHNRAQAEQLVEFVVHDLNAKLQPSGHGDLLSAAMQKAAAYYAEHPPQTNDERRRYAEFLTLYARTLAARGETAGAHAAAKSAQALLGELSAAGVDTRRLAISNDHELAEALTATGDVDGALAVYREAAAAADRGARDGEPWPAVRATAHGQLALALQRKGDLAAARTELQTSLELATALAAAHPDDIDAARLLLVAHDHLGLLEIAAGNGAAALLHYRAMQDMLATLIARFPAEPQYKHDLALVHTHIGGALEDRDDLAGALAEFRAGIALDEQLLVTQPENAVLQSDLADNLTGAAKMLMAQKQLGDARKEIEHAIAILEPLAARDAANADWAWALSIAQVALGDILSGHDSPAAIASYRAALAIRVRVAALTPHDQKREKGLGYVHRMLGEELLALGDKSGAQAELDAARAIDDSLAK